MKETAILMNRKGLEALLADTSWKKAFDKVFKDNPRLVRQGILYRAFWVPNVDLEKVTKLLMDRLDKEKGELWSETDIDEYDETLIDGNWNDSPLKVGVSIRLDGTDLDSIDK